MFENTVRSSWNEGSRRRVTALTSFGVQAVLAALLVIFPLLRQQGMPSFHELSTPVSWAQPLVDRAAFRMRESNAPATPASPADIIFMMPSRLPKGIVPAESDAPPQFENTGSALPEIEKGTISGVRGLFTEGMRPVLPVTRPASSAAPVRISNISEGNLIRKIQPVYPPLARSARIQGAVVLQAVISKEGIIENLRLSSGHPMLVLAAIDAVKQWRYRPYSLNSEPVEVETQITVNFSLGEN